MLEPWEALILALLITGIIYYLMCLMEKLSDIIKNIKQYLKNKESDQSKQIALLQSQIKTLEAELYIERS